MNKPHAAAEHKDERDDGQTEQTVTGTGRQLRVGKEYERGDQNALVNRLLNVVRHNDRDKEDVDQNERVRIVDPAGISERETARDERRGDPDGGQYDDVKKEHAQRRVQPMPERVILQL